jgi:type I restriction enzyme S subunit
MVGIVIRPAQYYVNHGVPAFRSANIREDGITDTDLVFISETSNALLSKSQTRVGDVLTVRTGYPGTSAVVRPPHASCNCIDILITRPTKKLDSDWLSIWINSSFGKEQVLRNQGGLAQKHFNVGDMRNLVVALPPVPEQRAIAAALSDVDALLAGLDRLITKKCDLKQAAMQQLLTGRTRLPGFHGEWEDVTLKRAAEIGTGINKPVSEMGRGTLYVTVQDLYHGTSIRTDLLGRIQVSAAEISIRTLERGDIVFGKSSVKREGIGYPSQFLGSDEPVVFSGFTYRARARGGIADSTFLFYVLRSSRVRRWLIDNSQASALTNINQRIADAIPVMLPPLAEQAAIAAVLSSMDAELTALETRREKTRALKQAMMQELLTGRTRLV